MAVTKERNAVREDQFERKRHKQVINMLAQTSRTPTQQHYKPSEHHPQKLSSSKNVNGLATY